VREKIISLHHVLPNQPELLREPVLLQPELPVPASLQKNLPEQLVLPSYRMMKYRQQLSVLKVRVNYEASLLLPLCCLMTKTLSYCKSRIQDTGFLQPDTICDLQNYNVERIRQ
jgi:hypothetical protein